MKRNLILISAIILLLAPLAIADSGQCMKMGMGKGMGMGMGCGMMDDCCMRPGMLLKMADEIGLDANQKTRISKLQDDFAMAQIDRKAELEKAELKLHQLMRNDATDKDVMATMDRVGQLKTEMQKMRFQHMRQIKAILTADQLKKLKEMMPKMGSCNDDDEEDMPGMGMRREKVIKMEMKDMPDMGTKEARSGPSCGKR
ncbi:MAG: hypothetical protein NTV06_03835 [candidate division Zixibacteria bacterium]|nr:hypothetical protein [candidate division Zixibacteria bacterium]